MEDSGAEPLEDNEINEIPNAIISSEQVQNALQCSVCLEFFEVNEEAKVLPCNHHFHESCLVPWLERRGTCPDCRLNLVPTLGSEHPQEFDIDEDTLSGYESAHSNMISSYVSLVSHDGDSRVEEIEDDSFHNLIELYPHEVATLFSHGVTTAPRWPVTSPLSVSDDDSDRYTARLAAPNRRWTDEPSPHDASGSRDEAIDDTTIDDTTLSSPSIFTISSETSDDDVDTSSESLSEQTSIETVESSIDTILSTPDISMNDDY